MLRYSRLHTLLLLLVPAIALAQAPAASPLPELLAEREVLTERYAAANTQRHSLFGLGNKPSKKDLQEVVDALQGIVDKDEQIVVMLNQTAQTAQTTATTLQNTGRDDRNLSAQRFGELQNDLQNAQLHEKQAAQHQQALSADLAEAQHGLHVREVLVASLALLCVGLFFWRRR